MWGKLTGVCEAGPDLAFGAVLLHPAPLLQDSNSLPGEASRLTVFFLQKRRRIPFNSCFLTALLNCDFGLKYLHVVNDRGGWRRV